jgi:hypothetical protein
VNAILNSALVYTGRACALKLELGDQNFRNSAGLELVRIVGIGRAPHPRLSALDCRRFSVEQAMPNDEARAAYFGKGREYPDAIIVRDGSEKPHFHIDDRNTGEAVSRLQLRFCEPCRLLQQKGEAPIEILYEAGVKDDAGGITMSPFDRQLAQINDVHSFDKRRNRALWYLGHDSEDYCQSACEAWTRHPRSARCHCYNCFWPGNKAQRRLRFRGGEQLAGVFRRERDIRQGRTAEIVMKLS